MIGDYPTPVLPLVLLQSGASFVSGGGCQTHLFGIVGQGSVHRGKVLADAIVVEVEQSLPFFARHDQEAAGRWQVRLPARGTTAGPAFVLNASTDNSGVCRRKVSRKCGSFSGREWGKPLASCQI